MTSPQQILQTVFGYSTFRPPQGEIISSILEDNNTLALLPTGQGKSLCYQIPGLALEGLTIVISPLIALMKDQVDALTRKGLTATYINSTLQPQEITNRYQAIQQGKYQFLYVAPERLLTTKFLTLMITKPPSFIAVDEAHCFSTWGHDFRPLYRDIPVFINKLPVKPKLALFTATASPAVVTDLKKSFKVPASGVFRGSFFRKNLFITSKHFTLQSQRFLYLMYLLTKVFTNQAGLIYVSTRKTAEMLYQGCKRLNSNLAIEYYHAGRTTDTKNLLQEKFLSNEIKIMIATNAFGMGIDKPDIRFVIHFQTPASLENYVQEIGRAGRDGQFSWCELLFHPGDLMLHQHMAANNYSLQKMAQYVDQPNCHHQKILSYFQDPQLLNNCGHCQYCAPYNQPYLKYLQQQLASSSRLPTFVRQQQLILDQNMLNNRSNLIGMGESMLE